MIKASDNNGVKSILELPSGLKAFFVDELDMGASYYGAECGYDIWSGIDNYYYIVA